MRILPRVRVHRVLAPSNVRQVRRGRDNPYRSRFEETVINSIPEGVKYGYEKEIIEFQEKVRKGSCRKCGGVGTSYRTLRYTPDLIFNGRGFLVEIKGKFTASNRSRMELVLEQNPDLDLRFVFQRDNWITKKHISKYSDWAEKLGLKYYVGNEIPKEWFTDDG